MQTSWHDPVAGPHEKKGTIRGYCTGPGALTGGEGAKRRIGS
jgi:hypothetical protein